MRGIRKAFSGVEVLHGVDFAFRAGEIHALIGENGAGKSTLIKILGGVHRDHAGEIRLRGEPVAFRGPRDAEDRGIAIIHQELALIPHLSVAENIFLGREPTGRWGGLGRREMNLAAARILRSLLDMDLDVRRHVVELPIAVQQMVEIAKALSRRAELLVMDEPTSALSEADTERLFGVIRQLRDQGVGIVYISHKLEEIYALADRITVLRDGRYIGTAPASELSRDQLVTWMVGREVGGFPPRRDVLRGAERLRVENVWATAGTDNRWRVQEATFTVRAGEIVGLAGLMGSGASELLGAIYGRYRGLERGSVYVDGARVPRTSPEPSLRRGLALLTNDRKASGLVLPMSVLHNMTLATIRRDCAWGQIRHTHERARCRPLTQRMKLRAPSLGAEVATLSGGNQQKVIISRWLLADPGVLLLDEPTRGIDVAAKADIYALLNELTAAGMAIVLITSELPELLALADRILVLHRGRIVTELSRDEATQERIMHAAMGGA